MANETSTGFLTSTTAGEHRAQGLANVEREGSEAQITARAVGVRQDVDEQCLIHGQVDAESETGEDALYEHAGQGGDDERDGQRDRHQEGRHDHERLAPPEPVRRSAGDDHRDQGIR